jgi:hypothetical protein
MRNTASRTRFDEYFEQTKPNLNVKQRGTFQEYKRITLDIGKKPFPDLSSTVTIPQDIGIHLFGYYD